MSEFDFQPTQELNLKLRQLNPNKVSILLLGLIFARLGDKTDPQDFVDTSILVLTGLKYGKDLYTGDPLQGALVRQSDARYLLLLSNIIPNQVQFLFGESFHHQVVGCINDVIDNRRQLLIQPQDRSVSH